MKNKIILLLLLTIQSLCLHSMEIDYKPLFTACETGDIRAERRHLWVRQSPGRQQDLEDQ